MQVSELMTRDVSSCHPEDSLNCAAQILWERDCGCVPVCRDGTELVGMLTDRDICMAAYTQGKRLDEIPVWSVMATQLSCCHPEESLQDAEQTMKEAQVRRLPVTSRDGHLVGILSLRDLVLRADHDRGARRPSVSAEEVSDTLVAICRCPERECTCESVAIEPEKELVS